MGRRNGKVKPQMSKRTRKSRNGFWRYVKRLKNKQNAKNKKVDPKS